MRFVGLDSYEAAGGGIRRDLFAEDDAGVYLTDAALLERLADGKGWMPAIFKAEGPEAAPEETQAQDASEHAEAVADEPAEALAA